MKKHNFNFRHRILAISLMSFAILSSHLLLAQSNAGGRNSMSVLFVNYNSGDPMLDAVYKNYNPPTMFDINYVGTRYLDVSTSFGSGILSELPDKIHDQHIPNKIIKNLLVNDNLGYMTIDVLEERGLYNASDATFKDAKNTTRGLAILKEEGLVMLNNLYFMVVAVESLTSTYEQQSTANVYAMSGTTYLYKIDLKEMLSTGQFWKDFFWDKNEASKLNDLMNYNFPVTLVKSDGFTTTGTDLNAMGKIGGLFKLGAKLSTGIAVEYDMSAAGNRKSVKQIQTQLLENGIKKSLNAFENLMGGFTVTQSIFKPHPLQVKIGKKESLRPDDLYEVVENVVNTKTGIASEEHVGWIRARKVVNNKSITKGKTQPSTFYRIASGKIARGMQIKKAKDPDWSFGITYNNEPSSILGGYYGSMEWNPHWWSGMRIGLDAGYGNLTTSSVNNIERRGTFSGNALTGMITLKPSINFHRLSIIPVGGVYYSYISISESTILSSSTLSKFEELQSTEMGAAYGADLGINLSKVLQLRAGYRQTYKFFNLSKDKTESFGYTLQFNKPTYSIGLRLFSF